MRELTLEYMYMYNNNTCIIDRRYPLLIHTIQILTGLNRTAFITTTDYTTNQQQQQQQQQQQ